MPYNTLSEPAAGRVIIAGAGPGDPDLITMKAVNALRSADVVMTDRLVSEVILHRYIPATASIVYVGKECRKKVSTPQATINELMVKYAQQGHTVVRLKGGDVSVFSNILDELQELIKNNIPYEIIPGITAALGAAASAGIPLTARGYATAVRFLTNYKNEVISDGYWKELAHTSDTLVFYMSAATITDVVEKLTANGIASHVHILVAEQATTCFEKFHICNIYEFAQQFKGCEFISPSLVMIGAVCELFSVETTQVVATKNSAAQQYFASVSERNPTIYEISNPVKNVV